MVKSITLIPPKADDGSSPSVITNSMKLRLNSMEEDHRYKVIVAGSNPAVATNELARSSIG